MNDNSSSIISKVWSFCNTLRDDGVSYGDYLEQLTYLLFLKMAHELSRPPYNRNLPIPIEFNWESLTEKKERLSKPITPPCFASSPIKKASWARYS